MTAAERIRNALNRLVVVDVKDGMHYCCIGRVAVEASVNESTMESIRSGIRTGMFCAIMDSGANLDRMAALFEELASPKKIDADVNSD